MRKIIVKAVSVAIAAVSVSAFAGELVTGDAAIAKFPASLQAMGLHTAKWMQLTNGVEYYYGRFTNMLGTVNGFTGSKNDLHMLRIDYKRAPVKMKFVDHTQESTKRRTTSWTAAQHNALFAINMTMEYREGLLGILSPKPQGYAKADGAVIPNGATATGTKGGFAFNDDKTYKFEKDWTAVDTATGTPKADAWDNVVTHEAYTIHDGVPTWGASATTFTRANYTFFGTTADGVLWACAVDGRREGVSDGLAYHEVSALQRELGCTYGVCCDGGGSTTMAIRKDLMTASDICDTQRTSSGSQNYYTMCYLDDGSERAVINQLLFVEGPELVDKKVVKNGDTLVFMGDSITWYGVTNRHGYVNLVVKGLAANGINVTWHGVGVKGDKSAAMLARFDADVIAHNPDVVTISAGVNDVWYQDANSTYEKFYANELQMVAKTKAAGAVPVLLSPTTAAGEAENDNIRRYAAGVREIAAAEGIPYADTFHAVRGWINDIDNPRLSEQTGYNMGGRAATVDGVHMAPTGDRQMARAVLAAFGLNAAEMSAAEAAWNADGTLIVKETYSDEPSAAVNLSAAEYTAFESKASASGLSVDAFAKQVFRQGIDSLAANPANESEAAGASIALTASVPVSFAGYDKLLHAADRINGTFDDACRSALLRGVRECAAYAAPPPAAPVLEEFFVQPASTVVTLSGMIASPGAGASACDIAFAYGTDADNLGPEQIVLAGQRNRFVAWIKGLAPGTTYHYTASVVNNATGSLSVRRQGSFTTAASGTGALEPSGDDDTAALQMAIDAAAASGGTVALAGGTYLVDAELAITNGVTVAGSGWRTTAIRQRATKRVATLDGGSTLRGVTLTGGITSGGYNHGGGAYLSDGHLVECRVLKNIAGATGNACFGGGVFLDKGTVERCLVEQNQVGMKGATLSGGGGIGCRDQTARGEAVVDACLVRGNRVFGNGGGIGFDVFYKTFARKVRNTTIVGNWASGTGGGVHSANDTNRKASLVDCIIAGNTSGTAAKTVDMSYTGGVDYCLFDVEADKTGAKSLFGSPAFVSAANNDYHLAANSPAKGAGVAYEGIGADLDGVQFANPPSIGCYEYDGFAPPVQNRPRVMFRID